jgi:hypothetical protein
MGDRPNPSNPRRKNMASKNSYLEAFTGSENHYRHFTGLLYTDGVKHLADDCKAYWLIDAISSWQISSKIKNDPMLRGIQFWNLRVKPDNSAVLTCERDMNDIALTQEIEYTDFPLEEAKFYLSSNILMLPSEY